MVPRRQGRFEHVYSRGHGRGDISPLLATTVYTVSRLGAGSQQLACSKAPKAKSVLLSEVLLRFTGDVWMQTLTNCENVAALLSWFTCKWRGESMDRISLPKAGELLLLPDGASTSYLVV
jgi:hypothetical protein